MAIYGSGIASGDQWVTGVAGATRYPTDGKGGGTATAANSILVNAKAIQLVGIFVSVATSGAINIVDNSGATISGLTLTLSTHLPQFYPLGGGAGGLMYSAANSNVGISCAAGITANLVYRQLA